MSVFAISIVIMDVMNVAAKRPSHRCRDVCERQTVAKKKGLVVAAKRLPL